MNSARIGEMAWRVKSRQPRTRGGNKVGVVPEPPQRRIGFPKSEYHVRADALDLQILAFAHDSGIALQVDHAVHQRRRIEEKETEQPAVACVSRSAEAQAIADVAYQARRAFNQSKH